DAKRDTWDPSAGANVNHLFRPARYERPEEQRVEEKASPYGSARLEAREVVGAVPVGQQIRVALERACLRRCGVSANQGREGLVTVLERGCPGARHVPIGAGAIRTRRSRLLGRSRERLGGGSAALHVELLSNLEDVRESPVEDKTGREVEEHEREHHRH